MEKVKLYIDEDLSDRLAVALRSRGYDAVSAHEVNMRGRTDEEQLDYSTQNNRVILTRNIKHFVNLQIDFYKKGRPHSGIIVTNYLPLKEMIKRIINFLENNKISGMKQRLEWLQNYK